MKRTGLGRKTTSSKNTSIKESPRRSTTKLAVSLKTRGVDLHRGRVYRVLADRRADADGYVRIVDDSGEDYLYPSDYFNMIRISTDQALRLFDGR